MFSGSIPALVTPFRDGAIDEEAFRRFVDWQIANGSSALVPCGTTGESVTMSETERLAVIRSTVEVAKKLKAHVIAGTGSNSTHHACELQRFAAKAGADAALSVNPYYNKPVQEGLYRHFMEQADAAALPIILYNIPGRTGVQLQPETVARLARHPNIRAVKEATGSLDSASEICARCPDLALLSGDDSLTLPFASVGGVGVVSVVSNVLPRRVADLCGAFLGGQWPAALGIHRELLPVCRALFAETNPIPVKAAMRLQGRDNGVLRLPMTEASPGTVKALRAVLAAEAVVGV
jgi:4-hydroxy-tetrahydrodipicolinate synthase